MSKAKRRRIVVADKDRTGYEGTIEEMDRAIRRLDTLESLILVGAALLALVGGAIGAFLLSLGSSLPFFGSWVVLSLLFFVVPGGFALWKQRRSESRRK
jgi:hypothetical protein